MFLSNSKLPSAEPGSIHIPLATLAISLLVSIWIIYTDALINNDGILYVETARLIRTGDWRDALDLYPWLFYPAIIAFISKISGIGLELSAHLLDALLSALLAYGFVGLVRDLGADKKTLLLAGFAILSLPYLNESRADIIRDHGYWAFYITSLWFLIRYYLEHSWQNALAWNIFAGIACLFRIQGIIFILILPLVLAFRSGLTTHQRIQYVVLAYALPILLLLTIPLWLLVYPDFSVRSLPFGEIGMRIEVLWDQMKDGMHVRADAISDALLRPYAQDYAMAVIVATLFIIVIDKYLSTITLVYAALPFIPGLRHAIKLPGGVTRILVLAAGLNVIILLAYMAQDLHLSARYVIPLTLTILPVVPYCLSAMHAAWQKRSEQRLLIRLCYPVAALYLLFICLDGLVSIAPSNAYIRNAGTWLRNNTPQGARLYTNTNRLDYYSGLDIDWSFRKTGIIEDRFLPHDPLNNYDYLAIRITRKTAPDTLKSLDSTDLTLIKVFDNRRGDAVRIFKITGNTPH